jgi:hypothetical protein
MALGQVAARISGDEYQALAFWYYASQLLNDESHVEKVIFEHDQAIGIDDICITYSDLGISDNEKIILCDYIQIKYHVDKRDSYSSENLIDPSFTNAKTSLLQKFWEGFNAIYDGKDNFRFLFISNWNWDQSDILFSSIREESNMLPDDFFTRSDKSKIGKVRESWKKHLSINKFNESKFIIFCRSLRFKIDWLSKQDLIQTVNDRLKANHLKQVDNARKNNPYLSIYNRLLIESKNEFSKSDLIDLLLKENLVHEDYINTIRIKSFPICCNDHNIDIVNKLIKKKKYISGIFVETGELKEQIRYVTNPHLFIGKVIDSILGIDFSCLFRYLDNEKISRSEYTSLAKEYVLQEYSLDSLHVALNKLKENLLADLNKIKPLYDHESRIKVFGKKSFSHKLSSHAYKLKNEYENILESINLIKARVVIIIDSAGKGKTNFICDLFQNYFHRLEINALFLLGSDIIVQDEFALEKYIVNMINYNNVSDFNVLMNIINNECKQNNSQFILVIDGINENNDLRNFTKILESFTEKMLKYQNVKLIFTCRSEYFKERFLNLEKSSFSEKILRIENRIIEGRTEKEKHKLYSNYFDFYKINPSSVTANAKKKLLEDPLLLRFFCEAYGDPDHKTEVTLPFMVDIHREEIFKQYQEKKINNISQIMIDDNLVSSENSAKRKIQSIFRIITDWMFDHCQFNNVPISIIEDASDTNEKILFRIIDEDILFRKDIDSVTGNEFINFTFDEYRDYILSVALLYMLDDDNKSFIEKYRVVLGSDNVSYQRYRDNWNYHSAKEGITKYLFIIGWERTDIQLKNILSPDEYETYFSEYIFEIDQNKIKNSDIEYLKNIFLKQNDKNLLYKLLISWDMTIYPKLNLKLLLSWLKELSQVEIDFKYQHLFENESDFMESLFDLCKKLLVKKSRCDESFHVLFESLLFQFGSISKINLLRSHQIFSEYMKKHFSEAVSILCEYLSIQDQTIQEFVASLILVLSVDKPNVFIDHAENIFHYLDKENSLYVKNIITRDYLKSALINIHNYNQKIFSSNVLEKILSVNTPIAFLEEEKKSPCRPSEKQDWISDSDVIDYEVKKNYLSWIAHRFGLHRCDASDEIVNNILPELGYDKEKYKSIEIYEHENRFYGRENKTSFRKKYLWQAIRILQGTWLDEKPYSKEMYEDFDLEYDMIEYMNRFFDPFFFAMPIKENPKFFSPIRLPAENENVNKWIHEKYDFPVELIQSLEIDKEEWVVIDALFSERNEIGRSTFFLLKSYLVEKRLAKSLNESIKKNNNFFQIWNDVHLQIYKNEISKISDNDVDGEYFGKYKLLPLIINVERYFELNNVMDDFYSDLHLIVNDIVKFFDLTLEEDFSYSKNGIKVIQCYIWRHNHSEEHDHLHIIKKSLLEQYLDANNYNLILDIRSERMAPNTFSEKNEKIFYYAFADNNKFDNTAVEKFILDMGIQSIDERWIAYRLFEIREDEKYKNEIEEIQNYLTFRKNERIKWMEHAKNHMSYFISLEEMKNEDSP